jgi:hypothetical protein
MELMPNKMSFRYVIEHCLMFSGTGMAFAAIQDYPLLLGFISGAVTGLILSLPVYIVVSLIHYYRGTHSR